MVGLIRGRYLVNEEAVEHILRLPSRAPQLHPTAQEFLHVPKKQVVEDKEGSGLRELWWAGTYMSESCRGASPAEAQAEPIEGISSVN